MSTRLSAEEELRLVARARSGDREAEARLVIGDRNVIREYCTISRGTTLDQGVTRIGSDNLFMAYTHVAHDCVIGDNIIMVNLAMIAGHVQIGDWAILSGYCAVHQHCKIGAHAFLANNCGVTRDVPPYVMAVGNPAVPHSINTEGLKRRGFSADQIRNLRNAYRILYRSKLPLLVTGGCDGHTSFAKIDWYNPAANTVSTVLGGPAGGGFVISALLYPEAPDY